MKQNTHNDRVLPALIRTFDNNSQVRGEHATALNRNRIWLLRYIISFMIGIESAFLLTPSIQVQTLYTITDLGTLGGNFSEAMGMNDDGQIVESSTLKNGQLRAFLYENGNMIDLSTLGGTSIQAISINNVGQIVGEAILANGDIHASLFENGVVSDLGSLGGSIQASDINDSGIIVGRSFSDPGFNQGDQRTVLYENGTLIDLGTFGGPKADTNSINNLGESVGLANINNSSSSAFCIKTVCSTI